MGSENIRLFLVAPNVSAQMGGEAIKALQIFEELSALIGDVVQITHIRNKREMSAHRLYARMDFLDDDLVDRLLWHTVVLRVLMTPWFSYRAVRRAEELAAKTPADKKTIIHQTEPNSPVATRWTSSVHQRLRPHQWQYLLSEILPKIRVGRNQNPTAVAFSAADLQPPLLARYRQCRTRLGCGR